MALGSNSAVKRTASPPLTLAVSPITRFMRAATCSSAPPCSKGFEAFWASSACAVSATSYHSCSAAPLPWPSAFSWAAPVFKSGRSLLAFGSNSAVKRTASPPLTLAVRNHVAFFLSPFIFLGIVMGVLFYPVLQVVAILRARERGVSLIAAIAPLVFVVSTLVLVGINRFVQGPEINKWTIYLVIIVPIVATIYLFFYVIAATRKSERVAREIRDA